MPVLGGGEGGAWPVLHILFLVMNRLNKTEFAIFIAFVSYDVDVASTGSK